jgi:hypothetical protein
MPRGVALTVVADDAELEVDELDELTRELYAERRQADIGRVGIEEASVPSGPNGGGVHQRRKPPH